MTPEQRSALDKSTAMVRSFGQAKAVMQSLMWLKEHPAPHYSQYGRPLEGRTAYLVGAGPGLDRNIDVLRRFALSGGFIMSVNTAAPALAKADVPIDTLVIAESVPATAHFDEAKSHVRRVVLEACSARLWWEAVHESGLPHSWFQGGSLEQAELSCDLDVPFIPHAGMTITAAYCLARQWGADRIALVGCDLAHGESGCTYAAGAGWKTDSELIRHEDGTASLRVEHPPEREQMHREAVGWGIPPEREVVEVPAWGGGVAYTTMDYLHAARWFEAAARTDTGADLINASESGMMLEGWQHMALEEVKNYFVADCDWPDVEPIDVTPSIEASIRRAHNSEAIATAVLEGDVGMSPSVNLDTSALVSLITQGEGLRFQRAGIPPAVQRKATYESMQQAAKLVRQMLGEEGSGGRLDQ